MLPALELDMEEPKELLAAEPLEIELDDDDPEYEEPEDDDPENEEPADDDPEYEEPEDDDPRHFLHQYTGLHTGTHF